MKRLKDAALVAALSLPLWFVLCRFQRQLGGSRKSLYAPFPNPSTLEALATAGLGGIVVFLVLLFTFWWKSKKKA